MTAWIKVWLVIFTSVMNTDNVRFATAISQVNMTVCEFTIRDIKNIKEEFDTMVKIDNVWIIFFEVELNEDFLNNTFLQEEKLLNGISRWIWIFEQHQHILTYPVDFDSVTLQFSQAVEKNIRIYANATLKVNDFDSNNYRTCIEALYSTISDTILNMNKTNWKFCHRYFEGQEWKQYFYHFTGSWLGYDFECFDSFRTTVDSATYICKGTVNIVIDIFIFILCLYLPLLFSLLPKRRNIDPSGIHYYIKGDCPYSFTRLILRLNKVPRYEHKHIKNVEQWFNYIHEIKSLKPEINLISFMYFIILILFLVDKTYLKNAIPDASIFPEIYYGPSKEFVGNSIAIFTVGYCFFFSMNIVIISYFLQSESTFISFKPFGRHKIDDFLKCSDEENTYIGYTKFSHKLLVRMALFFNIKLWKNTFVYPFKYDNSLKGACIFAFNNVIVVIAAIGNFVLYSIFLLVPMCNFIIDGFIILPLKSLFMGIFILSPCSQNTKNKAAYIKSFAGCFYKIFLMTLAYLFYFVLLIVYFYQCFMYYFLFVIQFLFRTIIYVIFVAGPLFSNISNFYPLWVIVLSVFIYIFKYTISFRQHYKDLLDVLLEIKLEIEIPKPNNSDQTADNPSTEIDQHVQYDTENILDKRNIINVEYFDGIAAKYLPLRNELFKFFLKIFFTGLFLYVTLDSISVAGNSEFSTQLLPQIITVALPAIAEMICSPFNAKDKITLFKDDIKKELQENPPTTIQSINNFENEDEDKYLVLLLLFPILHTLWTFICKFVCCCTNSISPGYDYKSSLQTIPDEFKICCTNKTGDESKPLIAVTKIQRS